MSKPTTKPPADPTKHESAPVVPQQVPVTKRFNIPRAELQRREAQYQHQRAAVKQRALVKQRKGR